MVLVDIQTQAEFVIFDIIHLDMEIVRILKINPKYSYILAYFSYLWFWQVVPRPGNIECALLGDCCQHGGGVADQGAGQAEQDGVDICGGQ
jgi:hypothetical protein